MHGIKEQINGLKKVIDERVKKLNFFESELTKAYDSNQRYALKESTKEMEDEIAEYRKKIQKLENLLGNSNESSENRTALEALSADISQISAQISDVNDKIDAGFAAVLNKLSAQDKYLINILTLSESHQNELAEFFVALDEKEIPSAELEAMTKRIDEMLGQHFLELPATLTEQWKKLNEKSAEYTDAKGKIKLKLPIIPSILEYEVETNWDLKKVAKQIWADFKAGKIFLK
jgi:predicted  nucleic acid-binding Zn-ribbon protein